MELPKDIIENLENILSSFSITAFIFIFGDIKVISYKKNNNMVNLN